MKKFESINKSYQHVFQPDALSIGIVAPLETYAVGAVPTMRQHVERVQLVEKLGFKAVWLRDIPRFRIGANYLVDYLAMLQDIGVNHLVVNLRFSTMEIEGVLERLAHKVLPHFHTSKTEQISS